MNLIKTSCLSGIETALKMASAFMVMKYIALKSGPEGLSVFGQFYNFIGSLLILLAGGFTTGLVRYLAEQKTDKNYLGNALSFGFLVSVCIAMLIFFNASFLSELIFKNTAYTSLFYLLALAAPAIILYQIILAALNGFGKVLPLIFCKSMASILFFCLAVPLTALYGVQGSLIALIGMQSLPVFIALWQFGFKAFKPQWNYAIIKEFYPFWCMSLVTLISTPLMLILVRIHIVRVSGWDVAGLWEAAFKISECYLLFITTALTTYYVPKLSKVLHSEKEMMVVREVFFWAVLSASILATGLYLFKEQVIVLLFSKMFLSIAPMLFFQLAGSVVKIACWVFSYYFLVTKNMVLFLSSELFFGLSFYLLSCFFFDHYGLIGLGYAFFINCLFSLTCFCLYFMVKGTFVLLWKRKKALNMKKEGPLCNPF